MSATDHSPHDRAPGVRSAAKHDSKLGLQGEALILELQSAKKTLDRNQRGTLREPAPARRTQGASPNAEVKQFPRSRERIDRFDHRVLQEPIPAKQTQKLGVSDFVRLHKQKVFAGLGNFFRVLRAQIDWLLSGAPASGDTVEDLREQLVRTHEVQVKAA